MSDWTRVPLGEVATIERRGLSPDQIATGTKYLGLENIDRGGVINGYQTIGKATVASTKFTFTAEHLLYGKLRPNLAKIARPTVAGVCSTDILPLMPGPSLDRDFLAHYLSQPSMVDYAAARAAGANLPRLSPTELAKFMIPLPPIEEQRRIAAILDQADALRAKRREALTLLDDLTQSIFIDMFGDPVSNPRRWPTRPMSTWGAVVTGNTPSRASESNYGPGIEWIKSDNIESGRLFATEATESLTAQGLRFARTAPAGAILIVCIAGSPASIGRAAMLDRTAAFNQQINALIPRDDNALFLLSQLRVAPELVRSQSTGGMKGLVSKSRLSSVQLIDPPKSTQQEFKGRVEAAIPIRESAAMAAHTFESLFEALQARAFSGRL